MTSSGLELSFQFPVNEQMTVEEVVGSTYAQFEQDEIILKCLGVFICVLAQLLAVFTCECFFLILSFRRTQSLHGPSPVTTFGPKACMLQNPHAVM